MCEIFDKFTNYAIDIRNGKLYCNNLDYFRKVDETNGIGDKNEGRANFTLTEFIKKKYKLKTTSIDITLDGTSNFLFCVSIHKPTKNDKTGSLFYPFDMDVFEKFKNMNYKQLISIWLPDELIFKIISYCEKNKISCIHSEVKYINITNMDNDLKKDLKDAPYLIAFIKDKKYEWQKEYRFLFYNIPPEMLKKHSDYIILNIGHINSYKMVDLETMKYIKE